MEDQSLFTGYQPRTISEGLQNFIDAMVEEIVLEGKPFDTQKKYLKKFSENEGLDYDKLEADITTFIEILDSLKTAFSKLQVKLAEEKGKECHVSEGMVKKLVSQSSPKNQEENPEPVVLKKPDQRTALSPFEAVQSEKKAAKITDEDDSAVAKGMKWTEAQYVKKPKRSEVNGPIPKVNNKPKKSVLPWVIGLTAVAIVLLALWLPRYSESKEFASCMTVDDYRNYVANYPNGRHREDALSYIENHVNDSIAQAEALRIEEEERAKKKCYEDAINMGKRKLEAKEFEEAKNAFAKAKDCPYFEKAVVDSWLAKCDTAKLEDLVCGEHLLSLQWISWDYFGRVKIEKESGGRYRCVGEQKSKENTDYLKLDGYITIISEKHLKFEGAIRSKVYHMNGGKEYCRKGIFDFKASGSRQYWREQKMNGADGCTDYVDIYFQKWKD